MSQESIMVIGMPRSLRKPFSGERITGKGHMKVACTAATFQLH